MRSIQAVDLRLGDMFKCNVRPELSYESCFIVVSVPSRVDGKIKLYVHYSRFSKVYCMLFFEGETLMTFE